MKLQDFLSTKAKCIKELDPRYFNSWDVGETYDISITIQVTDKNNDDICFEPQDFLDHFEPVLDEIDTSADSVDDAPYVSERPYFEAGQKAYCPWLNEGKLVLLCSYDENLIFADTLKGKQVFNKDGTSIEVRRPAQPDLFHATQENYELLSKLMPWVDYEAPPKLLTGSHLARLLCVRGKRRIYGYASNDKDMDLTGIEALCRGYNSDGFLLAGLPVPCKYFVPADIDTGEPLTEAVLNN